MNDVSLKDPREIFAVPRTVKNVNFMTKKSWSRNLHHIFNYYSKDSNWVYKDGLPLFRTMGRKPIDQRLDVIRDWKNNASAFLITCNHVGSNTLTHDRGDILIPNTELGKSFSSYLGFKRTFYYTTMATTVTRLNGVEERLFGIFVTDNHFPGMRPDSGTTP